MNTNAKVNAAAPEEQVQEQSTSLKRTNIFQNLKIQDGRIYLDNFEIKCVKNFELKGSASGVAEFTVKLLVNSKMIVN